MRLNVLGQFRISAIMIHDEDGGVSLDSYCCLYYIVDVSCRCRRMLKRYMYMLRMWGYVRSRVSVVSIATGYGLDDRGFGVKVPVGVRIFSSPRRPARLSGPPNLPSNGYRGALSLGLTRPGRQADHSPPSSAEVKKMWIYTSTPL
jgi:hypothetical protein